MLADRLPKRVLSLLLWAGSPLFAASPFLSVFPVSPAVPGLQYSGSFSFTQTYTPSGSQWAAGLDEHEAFFAALLHAEDASRSWQIRIGKGGQLYSIRGPFGEAAAPQHQPNAHWIDQIFQLVGVNRALNLDSPGHAYFIHQAGDYLDDPILRTTFFSPMLASDFDAGARTASALNWGQQAHIPNVNRAGLLYYERLKDLGGGIVEVSYVIYNFGSDLIDFLDAPWGGVRKSVLGATLIANPDGSAKPVTGKFGDALTVTLSGTGGWAGWTVNAADTSSPTLLEVFGKDKTPRPSFQYALASWRYGTGPTADDFEVGEIRPSVNLAQGQAMYFRVYLVIGTLGAAQAAANTLAGSAGWGQLSFTEDGADLVPLYTQIANDQTVMTTDPQGNQSPVLYAFAEPVANSLPLFVLRDTQSGKLRLSTDPCELCTRAPVGASGDLAFKPYDGKVGYAGFLGYVLPADSAKSTNLAYANLVDLVADRSYFPSTDLNKTLKAVASKAAPAGAVTAVSAASFVGPALAPQSIASAFGSDLATGALGATSTPLPLSLLGTALKVKDSAGVERSAPLFFVSPSQVNFLVPSGAAAGTAAMTVTNPAGKTAAGTMQIRAVAPAVFTANASGQGVAAAQLQRAHADGSLDNDVVFRCDASSGCSPKPIDLGAPSDQLFLVFYGTGIRGRTSLAGVSVQIGGTSLPVLFAGPQGGFEGLDQVNVQVPRSLQGAGELNVTMTVDGQPSNPVKVSFQ